MLDLLGLLKVFITARENVIKFAGYVLIINIIQQTHSPNKGLCNFPQNLHHKWS